MEAQAQIAEDADIQAQQARRMAAKYGLFYYFFRILAKIRRTEYVVLMVQDASTEKREL